MAFIETPDRPTPPVTPNLFVGVASPLWTYYSGAAMGGVAFWWMTRWARPVNLEALFARTTAATESLQTAALEAAPELLPVGGESAPFGPAVADPEAVAESIAERVADTAELASETVEATAEIMSEAAVETVEAAADATAEAVEVASEAATETVEAIAEPAAPALEPPAVAPRAKKAARPVADEG